MKAISLFSGAGGCSLGFRREGVEIYAAYDNAEPCVETYRKNFKDVLCNQVDLSVCNFVELRESLGLHRGHLDLIIGGPPCQGFTTAGARFWDDPRNKLLRNYTKALEELFPRWFMLENVEGILTTAEGHYLCESLKRMVKLGYTIFLKKVYMHEYGIPQRRKRVIIVGSNEGKCFVFPKVREVAQGAIFRNCSVTLKQAIGDLEKIESPVIDHVFKKGNDVQLMRIKALSEGQAMKDLPPELQHASFNRRSNRRVCDGTPSEKRGGAPNGLKRLS